MLLADSIFASLELWFYVAYHVVLVGAPVAFAIWGLIEYRRQRVHIFTHGV